MSIYARSGRLGHPRPAAQARGSPTFHRHGTADSGNHLVDASRPIYVGGLSLTYVADDSPQYGLFSVPPDQRANGSLTLTGRESQLKGAFEQRSLRGSVLGVCKGRRTVIVAHSPVDDIRDPLRCFDKVCIGKVGVARGGPVPPVAARDRYSPPLPRYTKALTAIEAARKVRLKMPLWFPYGLILYHSRFEEWREGMRTDTTETHVTSQRS